MEIPTMMKFLMKVVTGLRLVIVILIAAAVLIPPALVALPFRSQRTRTAILAPAFQFFSYLLRLVFCIRLRVEGREYMGGKYTFGHLLISNHLSLADTPLLLSLHPCPMIGKKEAVKVPVIGVVGNIAGNILFDRKDPNDRRRVITETIQRIRDVHSIYLFPEGTRSKTGDPKPEPHFGLIWAAWEANIPVLPIAIYGSQRTLRQFTTRVLVKFDTPLLPSGFGTREQFAQACWDRVIEMFNELKVAAESYTATQRPTTA
jgi:1-acyl-sn-glycerol-3-phosphate acyltransferase